MVSQFTPTTDQLLNDYEKGLSEALESIQDLQNEHDEIWKRIFSVFNEHVGEEAARFICEDGWVLAREIHTYAPKLDDVKLKKAIFDFLPRTKALRLWNDITVIERKVDQEKLARAVENERLTASVVETCIQERKPETHRVRRHTTKKDKELMEAGVFAGTAQEVADGTKAER